MCTGRDCLEDGSRDTLRRFKRLKDAEGLGTSCKLGARPCMGPCGRGPNVELNVAGRPVSSPGSGVRFWTGCEDDRSAAVILEAAGFDLANEYAAAPPKPLPARIAKFYRGWWKQINNALFALALVGVKYAYEEAPDVADAYRDGAAAALLAWQVLIRAAQGRMYARAGGDDGDRERLRP